MALKKFVHYSLRENNVNELTYIVVACIDKVAEKAAALTPLLQVIAVIVALGVIGLMVLKGAR